jgi:phosphopantothenoylcysteine decarboxylase/phosphopantothenate--cysteine ligase
MTNAEISAAAQRPPLGRNVLFQLSGSIAAYKACHVVSRLVQAGHIVQTVATDSALRFVGAATLEGLTGRPVATELFASGAAMEHIHLVRWADIVVLCPATANTINRLAAGLGDDLISTMVLAHEFDKPYLVAPAMNAAMYHHPATRRSLAQLEAWGVEILAPGSGQLACGEVGEGRLLEPELILGTLLERLANLDRPLTPAQPVEGRNNGSPRILVTSGGTAVPIDGVRTITNTSTGATGAAIAEHFAAMGYDVTLVHARDAVLPPAADIRNRAIRLVPFTTFPELDEVLRHELGGGSFDAVIHLAAVSDFDVDHLVVDGRTFVPDPLGKIDSGESLTIHLRRNHKILSRLKQYAHPDSNSDRAAGGSAPAPNVSAPIVVGFKLTNGASAHERAAAIERVSPGTDFVVHNDITEIDDRRHMATIQRCGAIVAQVTSNADLAEALERLIRERLAPQTDPSIDSPESPVEVRIGAGIAAPGAALVDMTLSGHRQGANP